MTREEQMTTIAIITDYTTGRELGTAEVEIATLEAYEAHEIGQWPEGIIAAGDLLPASEIERMGIEADTTVWIEE